MARKQRKINILTLLLIVGLILLVVAIVYAPKPVDWTSSYSKRHTIPLGMALVYEVSDDLFPDQEVKVVHGGMANYLEDAIPFSTNMVFINDRLEIDTDDWEKVLEVASAGNHVFMAAEHFSQNIIDSLAFGVIRGLPLPRIIPNDSVGYSFTNVSLDNTLDYWYNRTITDNYFSYNDSLNNTTILGRNHKGQPNFIRVGYGEGVFYINCNPIAFTNYHFLNGNKAEYIFKALSYLPVVTTIWDEKYKSGAQAVVSEMKFVLENKALRIAWYVFIFGIVVYMLFQGKRRQRAIPVVEPPKNTSLDFVETIARLYFLNQNHLNIAQKRHQYFLDYLRSNYFLDTSLPESRLIEETFRKTGVPERTLASIFRMASNIEKVDYISHEDLHQFNRQLEFFYKNCQ